MHKLSIVIALTSSLACGGAPNGAYTAPEAPPTASKQAEREPVVEPASSTQTQTQTTSGPAVLELTDVKVSAVTAAARPALSFEIHADGRVERGGAIVGTLTADGRFTTADPALGDFRLSPDGTIEGAEQLMRVSIAPNGTINRGGRAQASYDAGGVLRTIEPGGPRDPMRVEGPQRSRRAASFLIVLFGRVLGS